VNPKVSFYTLLGLIKYTRIRGGRVLLSPLWLISLARVQRLKTTKSVEIDQTAPSPVKLILAACAIPMLLYGGALWGATASLFEGFSSKIDSRRFTFYSDLPRDKLKSYVEFSNLFLDVVDRDFIKLQNLKKLMAVVTSDQNGMQRFLSQTLRRNEPPLYGIYIAEHNLFVTYDGSGIGTFAHEIMHPVITSELPGTSSWGWEGIPTFFEKFYGYKERDRLYLKWGYQNPWRIRSLGEGLLRLNLTDVINRSQNQSELRLVSVFLYQRGRLRSFLDLVRNGAKNGYATYFEAAFGRRLSELEPEWQKYLANVYARRQQIYNLPLSSYFESQQEFLQFELQIGPAW
jgi:hypothetical protein